MGSGYNYRIRNKTENWSWKNKFFFESESWANGIIYRLIGPSPAAPADGSRQPGQQGPAHAPGTTPGRLHSRFNRGSQKGLLFPLKQIPQTQILLKNPNKP